MFHAAASLRWPENAATMGRVPRSDAVKARSRSHPWATATTWCRGEDGKELASCPSKGCGLSERHAPAPAVSVDALSDPGVSWFYAPHSAGVEGVHIFDSRFVNGGNIGWF